MLSTVFAASALIIAAFLIYLGSIVHAFVRRRPDVPGDPDRFDWHLFVPCRDEQAVIGTTVDSLRGTFPHAHVWVIDDDSDDGTAAAVTQRAARDHHVHLVQRRRPLARTGKGDALNAAYAALNDFLPRHSRRDEVIVGVVDADGRLAANALAQVAGDAVFGNPGVGAAQLKVKIRIDDDPSPRAGRTAAALARYLVRMQDIEFRVIAVAMETLRSRTRSVALGGNGQFTRLAALDAIASQAGSPWHGSLMEDYELGVHVLLAGYENRFVADSYVDQEGVTDVRRLLTQRTRWAQGNIQCIRYLPRVVKSDRFTVAGTLETGYGLILPFLQMLGLILWPLLAVFAAQNLVGAPASGTEWLARIGALLGIALVLSLGPFVMWAMLYRARYEPAAPRRRALLWGVGVWIYVCHTYVAVTRAFTRLLIGRGGWAKTRRNGEDLSVGAVATEV